ncbi:hypothetical protein LINGRAHAP2_LOCUS5868 [Linum grandiflorum]
MVATTGRSGGLWVLWNEARVNVSVSSHSSQAAHLCVSKGSDSEWLLSAVYASPIIINRQILWDQLTELASVTSIPWALIGDFNELASLSERRGGARIGYHHQFPLYDRMIGCGLIAFTWFRKDVRFPLLQERLDRSMANISWRHRFPEASVKHLPRLHSDHRPILLSTTGFARIPKQKPFRFEAMWLKEPNYIKLRDDTIGKSVGQVDEILNEVAAASVDWNKEWLDNIFVKKRRLIRRLEGVERDLARRPSEAVWLLQCELGREFARVLEQEEIFWKQKSRIQWLEEGDKCTAFFHTSTKVRRKRNRIESLKIDGTWSSNPEEVKQAVVDYFRNLFQEEPRDGTRPKLPAGLISNGLTAENRQLLTRRATEEEVWLAVNSMKPLKAPGPDGFPPIFFQKS